MMNEQEKDSIKHQIKIGRELQEEIEEEMQPYLEHWRIASSLKRKLGKVRLAIKNLENLLENDDKSNGQSRKNLERDTGDEE